ncbi:hypothetical protein C8Q79DRAFT_350476 [Trametes meyenii]|nr:hypothetical protein C8Q79DRAFT_350476 [Trametes meyenii]
MPRAARSSLTDHYFPAFYACYLLKSVRTPRATATYIGSTPSPPRRIRQHNGEISQGAWKTKHNRPWVMQMIVHGFPSKLAALQFEWAWQHPHISRHLRDSDGKAMFNSSGRLKYLNTNVRVARSMISSHPYNTWPLRVKLFTEEAEKAWNNSSKDTSMLPLPQGVYVSTEFEGVDGKSGRAGSGRTGPIDVADAQFTTEHLKKTSEIFMPGHRLECSICHEEIAHNSDPLAVALCPAMACKAVSHLACLSHRFLSEESPASSDIIPRGGTCKACHSYILWGDIIRGCYRRRQGGVAPENELEEPDDQEGRPGQLFGEAGEEEVELEGASKRRKAASQPRPATKKRPRGRPPSASKPASYSTVASRESSSEREHFDLDAISTCDEESSGDDLPWMREQAQRKSSVRPLSSTSAPKPVSRVIHAKTNQPSALPASATSRGQGLSHGGPAHGSSHQHIHLLASTVTDAGIEDRGGNPMELSPGAAGPSRFVLIPSFREPHTHETFGVPETRAHAHHPTAQHEYEPMSSVESLDPAPEPRKAISGEAATSPSLEPVRPPKLRPFPDLPPLSQPPASAAGRRTQTTPRGYEVVEISD